MLEGLPTARKADLYRRLPAVNDLLLEPEWQALAAREGRAPLLDATRAVLEHLRTEITAGTLGEPKLEVALGGLREAVERELARAAEFSLRPVINATGVILHTNLGRAPLPRAAVERIAEVAATYSNLEFDIPAGERGKRDVHVQRLFARILAAQTGGEHQTVVVNNCAAAVLLALNTLAGDGGEIIVSRGELVEIGGAFRVPDVMAKADAVLREVGTTNRTRLADYERAITDRTRALLRVHRSNFEIVGFTEQPSAEELVALGRTRNLPVIEDLGSGALFDLREVGLTGEPTVADALRSGVDLVMYSGDKLLGGPQAGMLSGRAELVTRVRSNPLFRALRVDKLTYAALEATLMAYIRQDHDAIPAVRMMRVSPDEIRARAEKLQQSLSAKSGWSAELISGRSVIGGGSAPGATLPTFVLAVSREGLSANELAARLRNGSPCIVARVEEGRVLLDLRTVFPEQDEQLSRALNAL